MFKLGAHCVLYRGEIKTNTRDVLEQLSLSPVDGCELGQRFFGIEDRDRLVSALKEAGLELAAMHTKVINLLDFIDNTDFAQSEMEQAAEFVSVLPNKNILCSPFPVPMETLEARTLEEGPAEPELHDPETVRRIAENMDRVAVFLKDKYGVQLYFHNHNWEFADNALIWRSIGKYAPHVMFALDCGWAFASGYDPIALIREFPGRVKYAHLRDYKQVEHPEKLSFNDLHAAFVDLGEGDIDYPRLLAVLNEELGDDNWAVIEYELGNFDKDSYIKAASYVRSLMENL